MTVSAAKLEANRRNAAKSCGPKTQSGKDRSKLNAVKHGMRAATLVLLDEDPEALEERRAEWAASLMPRGAAEQRIVDDAVEYSWLRDRARRAQEARLATNIVNAGVDEAIREADEVLRLGQKLFSDHRGPLANYPHYDREDDEFPESVPLVSESEILDGDPEDPQRLVLHLQTTAGGCQWMLDRWAELRSILEEGLDWQSADKLKAVRLLGRHPIEAVDDRNVLMIFVACQALESRTSIPIPEIWYELRAFERKPYAERLIGRGIDKHRPKDAAAARQALYAIVDRATAQIALKAETHRERAEINDLLATDRLLFDDSPEGERLRRFDLACGRGLARSLDSLIKLRRAPELMEGPSSVLPDPLSAASDTLELSATPNETNEPTDARENVTNEPTAPAEHSTNEAIVESEIGTNEPTVASENATNEPTAASRNVTNEPTTAADVGLNAPARSWKGEPPGEPRRDPARTEPRPPEITQGRLESTTYTKTPLRSSTNQPTLAGDRWVGESAMLSGLIDGGDDEHFRGETDIEKASEEIRQEVERRKVIRTDMLRRLNKAIRTEGDAVRAVHRARRGGIGTEMPESTHDRRSSIPGSTVDHATEWNLDQGPMETCGRVPARCHESRAPERENRFQYAEAAADG